MQIAGQFWTCQTGSSANGLQIQQWSWLGSANQEWYIKDLGNGYSEISNAGTGKVLDVRGVSTANGAAIQQWDWLAGVNQHWQIIPLGSSYSEIANRNSSKVLDVAGLSLANGAPLQQWDWLNGLNQQWEITPVSSPSYVSTQVNLWYDPKNQEVWYSTSTDYDLQTAYYYGANEIWGNLYQNGTPVSSFLWGGTANEMDWGDVDGGYPATPGAYYEVKASENLFAGYLVSQVVANCGAACGDYYDGFAYSSVLENPQTTDVPVFSTVVWGAPIVLGVKYLVTKVLHMGSTGANGLQVPSANRSVFALKYKAFIPPAWVKGPAPPIDFCVSGQVNRQVYYAGDHRGFDPFSSSYRTDSEVTFSTVSGTAVGAPVVDAGVTNRYAWDALAADGYAMRTDSVLHDCHYTDDSRKESSANMHIVVSGGGGSAKVNFWGSSANLTSSWGSHTASIDWNITVTINAASNPSFPAYTVNYTHDCYPAHELYVGSQRIYGYIPSDNSALSTIAYCLVGGSQVIGSTVGVVN